MTNSPTATPYTETSSPGYNFGDKDIIRILHNYVGMGHLDAVAAQSRFEFMFAKMSASSIVPTLYECFSDRKIGGKRLERFAQGLSGRVANLEATNPSLEAYLDGFEGIGEEMMRISIDGQYTHQFDPGQLPIPIRASRGAYFGRKLFAYITLDKKMKTWQKDLETGQYNPVRNMFDLIEAGDKLSEYKGELDQLIVKAPAEYPPSRMSDIEKSFMGFQQLPISQRLTMLFGGN